MHPARRRQVNSLAHRGKKDTEPFKLWDHVPEASVHANTGYPPDVVAYMFSKYVIAYGRTPQGLQSLGRRRGKHARWSALALWFYAGPCLIHRRSTKGQGVVRIHYTRLFTLM